ncbi:MAG: radical SAM protein [Candidatus Zixiibacteriota bacterium]|nr:MAG: radical SAM protein [candidate division Zixibacteria bacterium]
MEIPRPLRLLLLRPSSEVYTSTPPMGILTLAAYYRDLGLCEVEVFDGRAHVATTEQVVEKAREFQPDVVGLSLFSMERTEGHETAWALKQALPNATIVCGGPYPTTEYREALQNPAIDFAVVGEGEISGAELLRALQVGQLPDSIPGVSWRRDGVAVEPRDREFIQNLDALPHPAWDLLDLEYYFYHSPKPAPMNLYQKRVRSAPVFTSRGCPYRCTYCHNLFGKKLRRHSVPYVLDEITYLKEKKGVEEIEVTDDIFNLDPEWTREFTQAIIDRNLGLTFSFPNGLRADRMTEEVVDALVRMGTYRIVYAVETGSPRIQKEIHKNVDLEKARRMIDYTASKGVSVGSFFILGFLDETEAEMRQTIHFACRSRLSTASFFILTPFPGTEIYRQAQARQVALESVNYTHYYALSANLSRVPDKKLLRLRLWAYLRFYGNPLRLLRMVRTTPLHRHFFRTLAKAFLYFVVTPKNAPRRDVKEFLTQGPVPAPE